MRARLLAVLMALSLPGIATTVLAQDAAGDVGAAGASPEGAGGEAGDMPPTTPSPSEPAPPSADASPAKPISAGLLLGYGISLEKGSLNPWGLGFGVRGGYNIDKIFLGVRFVYYLGDSVSAAGFKSSFNFWELGLEGGYDVDVASGLVVRPELGLGLAAAHASVSAPSGLMAAGSNTKIKPYLAPGASLLYDVAENIFIGLDARFQIVLASPTAKSLIFLANGGMRF